MSDKGEFLISLSVKRDIFYVTVLALCAAGLISRSVFAFEKDLEVGAHIGYSGTYTDTKTVPNVFDGLAVGAQIIYGITESVGVSLDGSFDLHQKYQEYREEEVTDEDDKISMQWVPSSKVEHYFVTTGAACLIYTIDITRLVPYFTAGVVGVRSDMTVDGVHDATWGIGLRLGGGVDYFFKRWTVGATILSDRYYGGDSNLDRRIAFLVRASYVFHFGAEILASK
jgi:hypothetical protein